MIAGQVQATCALEGQGVGRDFFDKMVRDTFIEVLTKSNLDEVIKQAEEFNWDILPEPREPYPHWPITKAGENA
jgi:hypothetical protein